MALAKRAEKTAKRIGVAFSVATAILQPAGWDLSNVQVDRVAGFMLVEVKRLGTGLTVRLRSDRHGRTYIERDEAIFVERSSQSRSRRYTGAWESRLLGRDHIDGGFLQGMRVLAHYLADNSGGRLSISASREAIALVYKGSLPQLPSPSKVL